MKEIEEEYIPFGTEWVLGLKRHSKDLLISLLASACIKNMALEKLNEKNNKKENDNNGWIKIKSDADFPSKDNLLLTCNIDKVNIRPIGRRTMWQLYKNGLITHYKSIEKPEPPIY